MTAPATTLGVWAGVVSDVGLVSGALTDAELNELSSSPPVVSTADVGWYRAASKVSLAVKSERQSSFPVPRALATGASVQRVPESVFGNRFQFRMESIEAGRPWEFGRLLADGESTAGAEAGRPVRIDLRDLIGGMDQSKPQMKVDHQKASDLKNISYQGGRPRSRRGFRVVNNESTGVANKPSAYYDATNAAGDTYHLVMIAGTLYTIDNGELIEVDTGWPEDELPTVATVGLKTFIATKSRVRVFQEGTVYAPGITAPTTGPVFVTSTPNVTNGVIALTPGYEYAYTFYDGTRLTESGPSDATLVVLPPGSSASSITLSVAVSAASGVSDRYVYRRKVGTGTWFKVGAVGDNSTTSFTDSAEVPPDLTATLESPAGEFVTADFPAGSAVGEVEGRLLVWGDSDDRRLVRISEVGDGERWHSLNEITTGGDMRAAVTHEGRLVLATDRTIEVVEGDWVRGSAGSLGIMRRVLDTSKGCFGPFAACAARGRVYIAGPDGIHVLGAGFVLKDVTQTISDEVNRIVASAVDTAGSGVVMEFDYISQELWICLSQATQDATDPKNRVVLTINLENGAWSKHDHALSFVRKVTDGTVGPRLFACDYFGNILEMEVYNGDGIQGNEAWIPATNTITSFSATAKTITKTGASFPSTLRGVSLVLKDVSTSTRERVTILSASGDTLTVDSIPSWLQAGAVGPPVVAADEFYVGGIHSVIDTKEFDGGKPTEKVLRTVELSLADVTTERY